MIELSRSALIIGGFAVRWYGVLIALGVLMALLLASKRETRLGLERETALNIALACVPAGIICARLYYVLFSWKYYAFHPLEIFDIRQGGLAIYGGVIGGALAVLIYSRVKKIRFVDLADLAAPSLALGQAIGRWGNFLNEEAFGRAVENPRLRFFPLAVFIKGSGWHYATFFYESLWCLLIAAALLAGEKKRVFRKSGDIFLAYLFLYGLERALVEGLRTDSLYLGNMRVSQILSLALLFASALIAALRGRKDEPAARVQSPNAAPGKGKRDLIALLLIAVLALGAAIWIGNYALAAVCALAALLCAVIAYTRG